MANLKQFDSSITLILIVLVLQAYTAAYCEDENHSQVECQFRLPRYIKPINYQLTFEPHILSDEDTPTFEGRMNLTFEALNDTNRIVLHAKSLKIQTTSISLMNSSGGKIEIMDAKYEYGTDFFIIDLKNRLKVADVYRLRMDQFDGNLSTNKTGFYIATYNENITIKRKLVATQFESKYAREVFPSLDEPEWKATFSISLIRPADFISISNEVLSHSRDLGNRRVEDIYKETVVMSTYLVAFVICQYHHVRSGKFRIFARPEVIRAGMADYSLTQSIKSMKVLEEYIGIPYAMEKVDQIAIPNKFSHAEAMENWGLIMYKERTLLCEKHVTPTISSQFTAIVIAHELSHQWFGNLVTFAWWQYAWLSEGIANYFGNLAASKVNPEWRLMDQFINVVHKSLVEDTNVSAIALNYNIKTIEKIPKLAYSKGGSLLRMFHNILTEEVFRRGIYLYLEDRKFNTSVPDDLYRSLQWAVDEKNKSALLNGRSVASVYSSWIDQPGFPLVTIVRDYKTGSITLKQKRFLPHRFHLEIAARVWPVPINFMFSSRDDFNFSNTTAKYWFNKTEEILIEDFPKDGFVIVNNQQTGFYRVNYDVENWHRIIAFLETGFHEKIHVLNRAQLIDDAFNLAKAAVLDYRIAFKLSSYMINETDYVVLSTFIKHMNVLKPILTPMKEYPLLQNYVFRILNTTRNQLEFNVKETDTHVDKLNRVNVMTTLCKWGCTSCRKEALMLFREWKLRSFDVEVISPDVQLYAFCGAAASGNITEWIALFYKCSEEPNEDVRQRLCQALACSEEKSLLDRLMDDASNPGSTLPTDEKEQAFQNIAKASLIGLNATMEYLKNNFESLKNSTLDLEAIIDAISKQLHTFEQLNRFITLALLTEVRPFSKAVRRAKRRIFANFRWTFRIIKALQFLQQQSLD